MGAFDIDGLVGDIIDDGNLDELDDDEINFIPRKDSSDEDNGRPSGNHDLASVLEMEEMNNSNKRRSNKLRQPGKNLNAVIDDIDVESPATGPRSSEIQESMDMEQFTLRDINPFGEEEEKKLPAFDDDDDMDIPDKDLTV